MSKLGLVIVMMLMVGSNNAQNYPAPTNEPLTYFVLMQTDDGQVFYVRLNNQLYSSSPAGHLILSQLKDSVYTIAVGFPGKTFPEQRYLLDIHQKDQALRLSRQDNRWGLYDDRGQALATVADPSAAERPLLTGVKKDDPFSQLMSAIVQDTAVMYNNYAATSPDSTRPTTPMTASIPIVHDSSGPVATNAYPGSPRDNLHSMLSAGGPAVPSSPTGVVKLSERKSSQFLSLVFTDHPADKKTDTIDVNIPVDSPATAVQRIVPPDTAHSPISFRRSKSPDTTHSVSLHRTQSSDTTHSANLHRTQSSDTTHSANLHRTQSSDTTHSANLHPPQPADTPTLASGTSHKPTLPFVNSDCHAIAADYDVDKLRVRMLDAGKDDDRIQAAYKVFKTKCFTTKQVRALSEVFTTDDAKFKFLATAYPFVSDDHFSELVSLFSDPVYAGRFRTLTDRQ